MNDGSCKNPNQPSCIHRAAKIAPPRWQHAQMQRLGATKTGIVFALYWWYCLLFYTFSGQWHSNTAALNSHHLPAKHHIPPEITRPSPGDPAAAGQQRRCCERRQKRGKQAGVWARLKANPFKPPLPTIFLSNARSIHGKMDEIRLHMAAKRTIYNCCCMIFTETWLDSTTPDAAIELAGLTAYRADRTADSGKKTGGGLCICISNSWCTSVTVVSKLCTP